MCRGKIQNIFLGNTPENVFMCTNLALVWGPATLAQRLQNNLQVCLFGPHNVSKKFSFFPHKYRFLDSIEKIGRIWLALSHNNNQQELSSSYPLLNAWTFFVPLFALG